MDNISLTAVFFITLALNFIFAMAGKGAAAFQMPIFAWLGMPLNSAKSVALLANTISLSTVTLDNIRSSRIDLRLGIPIIVFSVLFAPIGAYLSRFIERDILMALFAVFLIYAGVMAIKPKRDNSKTCHDRHPRFVYLSVIGAIAGLVSGLLAIGGGGIIGALMLWLGCQAKKITMITALAVPFSSFTGFIAYAAGGYISWPIVATVGSAALIGGYAGNKISHSFLPDRYVKIGIGVLSLLFAAKIIFDLLQ